MIFRDPPHPDKFPAGVTWKDHSTEADEILSMIAETLEAAGCCHGHQKRDSTPPMMYAEWIVCAITQREAQIKQLKERVEDLEDKFGMASQMLGNKIADMATPPPNVAILLHKLEWITAIHDTAQCPYCNRTKTRGHTDTCELKQALDNLHNSPQGGGKCIPEIATQ